MRQEAKGLSAKRQDVVPAEVTLSCGVAAFPEHGASEEDLLGAADRALYKAKGAGRDRVEVAEKAQSAGGEKA